MTWLRSQCAGIAVLAFACLTGCGGSAATTGPADASPDAPQLGNGEVLDGGSSAEAGPGGNTSGLACGSVSCPTTGAVCCAYPPSGDLDAGAGYAYLCVGGATCPIGDAGAGSGAQTPTVLTCTGAANCAAGTVCCVAPNDSNQGAQSHTSTCKATCGDGEAQLCDPAAASPGCTASAPCSSANIASWELPPTFATCGGVPAQ